LSSRHLTGLARSHTFKLEQARRPIDRKATETQQIAAEHDLIQRKAIDLDTYERQRDKLRQELTLTQIDRHSVELDKFDVEGILAFAERGLPRASDLWVQASLNQKQRLQQLFFPDGIAFDGKRFVRTAVTTHAFNYLTCADGSENQMASLLGFEPAKAPDGRYHRIESLTVAF